MNWSFALSNLRSCSLSYFFLLEKRMDMPALAMGDLAADGDRLK